MARMGVMEGATRTVWETLLEEKKIGATAFVLDLAKASERVNLPNGRRSFSQEDFACAMGLLRTPAEGAVRRMCGGAAPDYQCLWMIAPSS